MSRQADLLSEEGNDVSSRVMRDALTILTTMHAKHKALTNSIQEVMDCDRLCDSINYKGAPAGTQKKRARAMQTIRKIVRGA